MEALVQRITPYMAEGYNITVSRRGISPSPNPREVAIYQDIIDTCPCIKELTMALAKRLGGRTTCNGAILMTDLAKLCMSSRGHSLNHHSVTASTRNDFAAIWEFIAVAGVCATEKTREWLTSVVGNRTSQSYDVYTGYRKQQSRSNADQEYLDAIKSVRPECFGEGGSIASIPVSHTSVESLCVSNYKVSYRAMIDMGMPHQLIEMCVPPVKRDEE